MTAKAKQPAPDDFNDDFEITADQAADLVEQLQLSQAVDVHQLRDRATTRVSGEVTISPANYRERATVHATGRAREIQQQSLVCVLDNPLLVGDVFCLSLDAPGFEIEPSLAICERCLLLEGPAYEARFRFVQAPQPSKPND